MKKDEIPQDKDAYRGRDQLEKLVYYTDDDGKYDTLPSSGWESEIAATKLAWAAIEESLEATKQLVAQRKLSPLAYYIEKQRMNVGLVASYMGKWKWQIKRHFKPTVFDKLDEAILIKYASLLQLDVSELKNYNIEKD